MPALVNQDKAGEAEAEFPGQWVEKGNTKVYLQFKLRIGSMIIFSSSVLLHRHWYGVNRILDLNKFGICKL